MVKPIHRQAALSVLVAVISVLAGWTPPGYFLSAGYAGLPTAIPTMPTPMQVPSTPIVPGNSALGYLPGSGGVGPDGQYTYTIPIDVPPGRAGMQPNLALSYSSGGGNGALGVGWSLSGTSAITRCRQTLASEGVTRGPHFTDATSNPAANDRYCLDGKKLVAINGQYGQPGTTYATEEDSYAQIVASAAPTTGNGYIAQAPNEQLFTVLTKDGRTLVYTALYISLGSYALHTATAQPSPGMPLMWALRSATDRAGNGMQYHYTPVVGYPQQYAGNNNPLTPLKTYGQMTQWELSSIVYTTHTTPAGVVDDPGERTVTLGYEDIPVGAGLGIGSTEFGFQSGAGTALFQRLIRITLSAPNPLTSQPVWQYNLVYQNSAFSNRSQMVSAQRCAINNNNGQSFSGTSGAMPGGCTWAKVFAWTTTSSTPQWASSWQTLMGPQAPVQSGLQGPLNITALEVYADPSVSLKDNPSHGVLGLWPDNPPIISVLDVDGDGRDDVMFQTGGPGGPSSSPSNALSNSTMLLFTAPPNAAPVAVTSPLSVWAHPQAVGAYQSSADSANGGDLQALQSVVPLDLYGDGKAEIMVTQSNYTAAQTNIICQNKVLGWRGAATGFVDTGVLFPAYDCTDPLLESPVNILMDLNGDHLLDKVQAPVTSWTYMGNSGPTFPVYYVGPFQSSELNYVAGSPGFSNPASLPGDLWATCPYYVVDFTGDGRGQLFGQSGNAQNNPFLPGKPSQDGYVNCGGLTANTVVLNSFDPLFGQWTSEEENVPLTDADTTTNPKWPIAPDSNYLFSQNPAGVPGLGTYPNLIFADFNGDGLEDVLEPDQDPANQGKGMYWLRWNTGNGFGPRIAVNLGLWAQANPVEAAQIAASEQGNNPSGPMQPPTLFKVIATDLNHDGRADLVVFATYPTPAILLLLSAGDGTFITGYVGSPGPVQDPGMFTWQGNWLTGVGDFNGDGYTDLIRVEAQDPNWYADTFDGNAPLTTLANLQYLTGTPPVQPGDRIVSVTDQGTAWPREAVTYSLQWSDKPEAVTPCAYPLQCGHKAFWVARELDRRDALVDVQSAAQVDSAAHRIYYSYEDPRSDLKGRGSLGFRKVREWDPSQPRQTITLYDNRDSAVIGDALNYYYPYAMRPQQVTTVVPIPQAGSQALPVVGNPMGNGANGSINARVIQTTYTYVPVVTNNGLTYAVRPLLQTTKEWEQEVTTDLSVTDPANPTSDYIWTSNANPAIVAPANPLRVHSTSFDAYDTYGNVLQTNDTVVGGIQSVTTASYTNNPQTWQIGQLQWSSTTQTDNGVSVTHQAQYGYDPSTGLLQTIYRLQQETPQMTPATIALGTAIATTTLGRDSYGNVTSISTTASVPNAAPITRQINIQYDNLWCPPGQTCLPNERIFPSQTWVPTTLLAWAPSSWTLIHPAYGVTVATMDANGVQTTNSYDDQGRLIGASAGGEAPLSLSYAPRPELYASGTNGMTVTALQAGQTITASSDADGRALVSSHIGFDGTVINDSKRIYDTFGRTLSASRPYEGSTPSYQTSYVYDGLSRVLSVTGPDSVMSKSAPSFFSTTTTDPNGNQSQSTRDVNGRLVTSANLLNGSWVTTTYQYTPLQTSVTDPLSNVETTTHDSLGRVITHINPDMGTTTSLVYDGFDELLGSTHSSGDETTLTYDALGRMSSWCTINGSSACTLATAGATGAKFTYDTQLNGLGKLASAVSSDNVTTVPYYDVYGRTTRTDETVGGQTYTLSQVYNTLGQLVQLNYPGIQGSLTPWIALQNKYNAAGYLYEVDYSQNGAAGQLPPIWRVESRNLDDALVQATFGNTAFRSLSHGQTELTQSAVEVQNSYVPATGRPQQLLATPDASANAILNLTYGYYPNGLVKTRTDAVNGRQEGFQYDSLNRLTNWNLSTSSCTAVPCAPPASAASWQEYAYDNTGNLTQVSQWEKFALKGQSPGWGVLQSNTYGGGGGGPHALSTQTNAGVSASYNYDTHGRQTTGTNQTLTYNAYDLPKTVTYNGATSNLLYDAFGQRVRKSRQDGTSSTVYVGGIYEKRTTGSVTLDVFHVPGGQLEYNESGGNTTEYGEFTDALGSVGTVFNGTAGVVYPTGQPFFYDPFGARINVNGMGPYNGTIGDVHDGFTDQEHDDEYGLINFKGRMYNPTLKRFLSPDPHVTHPGFGQSWNPYSYVMNSPLNFVDPSGFDDDGSGGGSAQSSDGPPVTGNEFTGINPGDQQVLVTYHQQEEAAATEANPLTSFVGTPFGASVAAIPQQSGASGSPYIATPNNAGSLLINRDAGVGLKDTTDNRLAAIPLMTEAGCAAFRAQNPGVMCIVKGSWAEDAFSPVNFALGTVGEVGAIIKVPAAAAPGLLTRFANLFRSKAVITAAAALSKHEATRLALEGATATLAAEEEAARLAQSRLQEVLQIVKNALPNPGINLVELSESAAENNVKLFFPPLHPLSADALDYLIRKLPGLRIAAEETAASLGRAQAAEAAARVEYEAADAAVRALSGGAKPSGRAGSAYRGNDY